MAKSDMWGSIGVSVAGALGNWMVADAKADAADTINKANAAAANLIRQGENAKRAAETAYNVYVQSENARRGSDALAQQHAQVTENLGRTLDAYARASLTQKAKMAGDLGSLMGRAAFTGTGGSTVTRLANLARARQQFALDAQDEAVQQQVRGMDEQRKALVLQQYRQGVVRNTMANLDKGVTQAPTVFAPSALGAVLDKLDPKTIQNALSSFKSSGKTVDVPVQSRVDAATGAISSVPATSDLSTFFQSNAIQGI